MRLDSVERHSAVDAPLQHLDARLKLIATLFLVLGVLVTPIGAWRTLAGEAMALAFLVGVSGIPPRTLAARWLGFVVLFGFLSLTVAPARPERAEYGVLGVTLSILAKESLAFLLTLLLGHVTPFPAILTALRRLGVPATLVATLQFMYRYLFVLVDELERMAQARRARTFRRSGRLDWGLLTGLIGVLFLRTFERAERVHAAMQARGWDGTIRTPD